MRKDDPKAIYGRNAGDKRFALGSEISQVVQKSKDPLISTHHNQVDNKLKTIDEKISMIDQNRVILRSKG